MTQQQPGETVGPLTVRGKIQTVGGAAEIESKGNITAAGSLIGAGVETPDASAVGYNAGSGLSSWIGALGAGRNHVVIFGDSNASFDSALTTWADGLAAELRTLTGQGDGGPGFRHLGLAEWSFTAGLTQELTTSGLLVAPNGYVRVGTANADVATWTPPAGLSAHTRFAVYQVDDNLLQIAGQYSDDGGAFTTLSGLSFAGSTVDLIKQEIAGTIATSFRWRANGAGLFGSWFAGAAFYNGTTGLVVHNLAQGGADIESIHGTTNDRLRILEDLDPVLTIIWTGTNELLHGGLGTVQTDIDVFYRYYTDLVRRARASGDVLMIWPQDSQLPSAATPDPSAQPHTVVEFERVARRIALEQDAAYLSFRQVMGSYARVAGRGRSQDSWHLNQAGQDYALSVITRFITANSFVP